jgi:hypothetical protein
MLKVEGSFAHRLCFRRERVFSRAYLSPSFLIVKILGYYAIQLHERSKTDTAQKRRNEHQGKTHKGEDRDVNRSGPRQGKGKRRKKKRKGKLEKKREALLLHEGNESEGESIKALVPAPMASSASGRVTV